jgi:tRNA(Leu) C34 or U34 (ribose-2'-O)-methylase TrmL
MRHVVSFGLPRSALQYFSTLSHKRHDSLEKTVTEHKTRVSIFSTTFVRNIYHSKKKLARFNKNVFM